MSYQLAICDDRKSDIEYVSRLIEEWATDFQVPIHIESFPSAESFLFHYADHKDYDILILDIEMGEWTG